MKKPNLTKEFEKRHLSNTSSYLRKVRAAYEDAINEVTIGIDRISFQGQVFQLSDYPSLQRRIDNAIKRLRPKVQTLVISGIEESWKLSNEKNNLFVDRRMALKQGFSSKARKVYYDPNIKALEAFKARKRDGLGLSDRVWNLVTPYKYELEKGLAEGISVGRPAAEMARELKSYLNDPDKLFRRVRDAEGKLKLSKAAKEYNPGQGVYRSSYKNAARLTRTETNMAYRTADHERWKTLPFVTGIQVQLSNAHPKYDICDPLVGQYPKDFKFVGWHAQCLCFATPVMMDDAEFEKIEDAILAGDPIPDPKSTVNDLPDGFKKYMTDNKERIAGWKNEPYFIRDNKEMIKASLAKPIDYSKDPATIAALKDYTLSGYYSMNRYLRGEISSTSQRNLENIDLISRYLENAPKNPGVTYRGMKLSEARGKEFAEGLFEGKLLIDKGFLSTSVQKSVAEDFAGQSGSYTVLYEIRGKKGVDISKISEIPTEKEVLFNKDTVLKVSQFTVKNNGSLTSVFVTLQEL